MPAQVGLCCAESGGVVEEVVEERVGLHVGVEVAGLVHHHPLVRAHAEGLVVVAQAVVRAVCNRIIY